MPAATAPPLNSTDPSAGVESETGGVEASLANAGGRIAPNVAIARLAAHLFIRISCERRFGRNRKTNRGFDCKPICLDGWLSAPVQRVEGVALLWPISVVTGRIDGSVENSEFPYVREDEASRGRGGPAHSGGARRRP